MAPPRRWRTGVAAAVTLRACSILGLSAAGGLCACGPSFEVIQEGDLRFAHCDRLDLDPTIAPSHRLHCWREWRRVYTYGQTRDRVDYAQRRIAEVVSGDTEPPFVLPIEPVFSPPRTSPGAPAPREPAAQVERLNGVAPDPVGSCRERCNAEHAACLPGCETKPTGCKPCEPTLESCLAACGSGG